MEPLRSAFKNRVCAHPKTNHQRNWRKCGCAFCCFNLVIYRPEELWSQALNLLLLLWLGGTSVVPVVRLMVLCVSAVKNPHLWVSNKDVIKTGGLLPRAGSDLLTQIYSTCVFAGSAGCCVCNCEGLPPTFRHELFPKDRHYIISCL